MRLRPAKAQWFETYVPRERTVQALEALAATGAVELESDPRLAQPMDLAEVRRAVERFRAFSRKYRTLIPKISNRPEALVEAPEVIARAARSRLHEWSVPIDRLIDQQVRLEAARQNLLLLYECLTALHEASRDFARLAHRSRFLYKGVFACPRQHHLQAEICAAIDEFVPGLEHDFFIVADLPDQGEIIERAYRNEACLSISVPSWLPPEPERQKPAVSERLRDIEKRIGRIGAKLEAHSADPHLHRAIADMNLLRWYVDHAGELTADRKLCHVTGWTTETSIEPLQEAFRHCDIRAVVRFAQPPVFTHPPVSLTLPPWAKPFRLFVDMLGTPDSAEIDPSNLLPLIVPLLFGYMFPDVGHGLLLALFSLVLYRRWPQGRFLLPCGLSAAAFGVIFGEVFGLEHLLEPLWFSPLDDPLRVLTAPMVFGAALMLVGLLFNGLEAHWRGDLRGWLLGDFAVLIIYAAALAAVFRLTFLWGVVFGLLWFLLGQLLSGRSNRLAHLASNFGRLLQGSLELALNTFSFLRVGAFALAHAGLSIAILQLADSIDDPIGQFIFLVFGHLAIIAIEGLVVFVQTTRLVLFEFFIRFLHAEGRVFRPLKAPAERQTDAG